MRCAWYECKTASQTPSLLAKIYGVYEIAYRNNATGKTFKQDVLVMENLFYNRKISKVSRLYIRAATLSHAALTSSTGFWRSNGPMADL